MSDTVPPSANPPAQLSPGSGQGPGRGPVLTRSATPPLARRGARRLVIAAGALGAAAVAAGSIALARVAVGPSAKVDVHIAMPAAPAGRAPAALAIEPAVDVPAGFDGRIQLALLLDTSSSMGGLIDQARSQLWKMVAHLGSARRDGKRPTIEIALYEYGNDGRSTAETGWVRRVLPFTADLDRVSEALFSLDTNGGEEYVGKAVAAALSQLEWSERKGDLKLMFVAGNEEFDQGPTTPVSAMADARAKGVAVTAILCGGGDPTWPVGTRLAGMGFFTIDHEQVVAHIAAPQDAEIERLSAALNETYLAYGAHGAEGSRRQAAQDQNSAASQPGSAVHRGLAKSSANYDNSGWDLVDGVRNGAVALERLRADELPPSMRGMTPEGRRAHVAAMRARRGELQRRIAALAAERDEFVASARQQSSDQDSLDSAMLRVVSEQAARGGFRFD